MKSYEAKKSIAWATALMRHMRQIALSGLVVLVGVSARMGWCGTPWLQGETDRDPVGYGIGEKMTFTVVARDLPELPSDWHAVWERTGDDGKTEKGTWEIKTPLVYSTSLNRAGFVRLLVAVKDGTGAVKLTFDGGAAADVRELVQSKPEPRDFDDYWKRELARLRAMPFDVREEEIPSPTEGVRLYRVRVNCLGGTGVTTGYLSVPTKPGKYLGIASFMGYGASWRKDAYLPPKELPKTALRFHVSAHGFELGREESYYRKFQKAAGSNGYGHGFDPEQNVRPETCYFRGMALRVIRAVDYLKTRSEWDGRNLMVSGGSQGSLQAMWCAAFVPGVTEARLWIPWLCDVGGPEIGRNHGPWFPKWAPGLDYFDQVNVARRVPESCRVIVGRVGLGDYTAPPCGAAIMYSALSCQKSVKWVQGSTHGYVPPRPQTTEW